MTHLKLQTPMKTMNNLISLNSAKPMSSWLIRSFKLPKTRNNFNFSPLDSFLFNGSKVRMSIKNNQALIKNTSFWTKPLKTKINNLQLTPLPKNISTINTKNSMSKTWKSSTLMWKSTNFISSNGKTFHMHNVLGKLNLWSTTPAKSSNSKTGTKSPIAKPEKESKSTTKSTNFCSSFINNPITESSKIQTSAKWKKNYIYLTDSAKNRANTVEKTSPFSKITECSKNSSSKVWIGWSKIGTKTGTVSWQMKWVSEKQFKQFLFSTICILTKMSWVLSWYWPLWQLCPNGEDKFNSGQNSTVCFITMKAQLLPEKSSKTMNFSICIPPKMETLYPQKSQNFKYCSSIMNFSSTILKSLKRYPSSI